MKKQFDKNFEKTLKLFKEKTKRDCYKIEITKGEPSILDDKLGGLPYLPIGEEYPKDDQGNPLSLLLQVNLNNVKLKNFPNGILEIFTNNDWPCKYSIKLFKNGLEYQKEFPKLNYQYPFISKPLKIKLTKDVTYMTLNDYRTDQTLCPIINKIYGVDVDNLMDFIDLFEDDTGWAWHEDFNNQLNIHKMTIGGYADFTQTDPRFNTKNDLSQCLFKIDSGLERIKEIQIGDSGIVFGLISENDLKSQNFDNALVDWDCL